MAQQQQTDKDKAAPPVESVGVENLIGRLRDQGIGEGKAQADSLVADAKRQAVDIVEKARREAEAIVAKAQADSTKLKAGGEDAIRLAMRDTILAAEGDMLKQFSERLRRLVKGALADPKFIEKLILEVAGKASGKAKTAEILLPAELVSLEDLQSKPEEAKAGTLMHFVLSEGAGMLRDGMSFGVAEDGEGGIRVKLAQEDLQIDVTESAVSELLLKHMLPRYRAVLRGTGVAADSSSIKADAKPGDAKQGDAKQAHAPKKKS